MVILITFERVLFFLLLESPSNQNPRGTFWTLNSKLGSLPCALLCGTLYKGIPGKETKKESVERNDLLLINKS
jgi:hypothetical protein